MNSQLNPNAAVFIPVSPTRLLMMDDAIITASPGVQFEEPAVNIEYSSGPKHVDYFMRDNFSTVPNKTKELTSSLGCSVTDISRNPQEHMEHISIDQLLGIHNIQQKDMTFQLGKADFLGTTSISSDNESGNKTISGNNTDLTVDLEGGNSQEDMVVSGTTTILNVEVTLIAKPTEDEFKTPNEDSHKEIHCENILPHKEPSLQKKRSKWSRYRNKRRSRKVEPNVVENSEGFITEHRKTPPLDLPLKLKPIQNFSDANPFGALQTPTNTTPTDQIYNLAGLYKTPVGTPKKAESNEPDTMSNVPPSFILLRSPVNDPIVPFEELESPNDLPPFVHPPNANRVVASIELPKSPEIEEKNDILPSKSLNNAEINLEADKKSSSTESMRDFNDDENSEKQDTTFTSENTKEYKSLSNIELNTTDSFLRPEYTICQQRKECEHNSNLDQLKQFDVKEIKKSSDVCNELFTKVEETVLVEMKNKDPSGFQILSESNSKPANLNVIADHEINVRHITLDIFDEETNSEIEETSFTNENEESSESTSETEQVLIEAEPIFVHNSGEISQISQVSDDIKIEVETHTDFLNEDPTKYEKTDSIIKEGTMEMRLEFQDQIPISETTPEELRNLVQGFEVINKDELIQENYSPAESVETVDTSQAGLIQGEKEVSKESPLNESLYSIVKMDDIFEDDEKTSATENVSDLVDQKSNNGIMNANFSIVEDVKLDKLEKSSLVEKVQTTMSEVINPLQDVTSRVENEKSVEKEEIPSVMETDSSLNLEFDQGHSMMVTETLTTSPEEVSRVPIIEITEVPQIEGETEEVTKESPLNELPKTTISEVTDPHQDVISRIENEQSVKKEEIPYITETDSPLNVALDQAQSMMLTEALTTSPEEDDRIPIIEMTEITLITETVPSPLVASQLIAESVQDLRETGTSEAATEAESDASEKSTEQVTEREESSAELNKPSDGSNESSKTLMKQPLKPDAPLTSRPSTGKTTTSLSKPTSGTKTTISSTTAGKTSTAKLTATSTTSAKLAASSSGSAKSSTASVATSKSAASSAAKPSGPTTTSSKTTTSGAGSSKSASSTASSKPTSPSTVPSKSTTSSVAPSKPTAPGAAPPKSSVSGVNPSKSSASTVTSSKTTNTSAAPTKPAVSSSTTSKPVASSATPSKPSTTSKPAAASVTSMKPAVPSSAPAKPAASSSTTTKPANATTAKKPAAASTAKPAVTKSTVPATKPTTTSTNSRPVPKQLPVVETTPGLKSPTKPSSPNSNPTTPTSPNSPLLKTTAIKSPPRAETKPTKPATDKKTVTSSDAKSIVKKTDVSKNATTVTAKPSTPIKPGTSTVKTTNTATKPQTPTPSKTTAAKTTAATGTKPKLGGASDEASNTSGSAGVKKPATASVAKTVEKSSKEPASGKIAANGKSTPTKTPSNVKADPKSILKSGEKLLLGKKPEEGQKVEKTAQVQEQKVSTTKEIVNIEPSVA